MMVRAGCTTTWPYGATIIPIWKRDRDQKKSLTTLTPRRYRQGLFSVVVSSTQHQDSLTLQLDETSREGLNTTRILSANAAP